MVNLNAHARTNSMDRDANAVRHSTSEIRTSLVDSSEWTQIVLAEKSMHEQRQVRADQDRLEVCLRQGNIGRSVRKTYVHITLIVLDRSCLSVDLVVNRSGKRSYCPLDCQAGGTCVFVQSTPRCRCPKNRTGRLCESSTFSLSLLDVHQRLYRFRSGSPK